MSGVLTPFEEDLLAALDAREIAAYRQVLGAALPVPGVPHEEDRAVAFIRSKLRSWGIPTTIERFPALVSVPGEARLSLARRNAAVPALVLPYSPATPDAGIVAELRVAPPEPAAGAGDDLGGAIALIDGLPSAATVARLAARGALAQIYVADDETLEPVAVADERGGPAPVPVALIGRAAGEGFLALAAAGATPVRLRVAAGWATRQLALPVATIRGVDEPETFLLLGAQLAGGDAAACLLELCRVLAEGAGRLRRGVRCVWWPQGAATATPPRWYAEQHWDDLGAHVSSYVELDAPESRASQLAAWGTTGLRPFAELALREGGVRAIGWDEGGVAPAVRPFARRGTPALRLAAGQARTLGAVVPTVARLCTMPLLPLDIVGTARAIDGRVRATVAQADAALDLAPLRTRAVGFLAAAERLQIGLLHIAQADSTHYEEGVELGNRALRRLARLLLPILHLPGDPYGMGGVEGAGSLLPGLDSATGPFADDDAPTTQRQRDAAIGDRNRLLDVLGAAIAVIEETLTTLRPLGFG